MEFNINHPILFVMAGILVAVVLAQSVYFLVKALRRSKQLGMDQAKIKRPSARRQSSPLPLRWLS